MAGPRLTPNLFGVAFGFAGLAQCWTAAAAQRSVPAWPSDALWVAAAALWLFTLVAYLRDAITSGRWRTDPADPTFGPFVALVAVVPMLLGVALAAHQRTAGVVVFVVSFVLTLLVGGWLTGGWILADTTLRQWHPGYFLPTVAGGLIASVGCSALGYRRLAWFMFGYGVVCWLVLGSILLLRLFTEPPLPPPLVPTMAIEIAPPVVAGAAWFGVNGGRVDAVALGLAGYALLMAMVQVRLISAYRKAPFAAGWWSFSFSYAAAFAVGIRWLAVGGAPGERTWTWVLLAVVTAGIAALAARTVSALVRHEFLPGPPPPR